MTFTIISQPYLDTYNKNYINILTVNVVPQGPLSQFVRRIQFPQLSPYQQKYQQNNCGNAIRESTWVSSAIDAEWHSNKIG